MEKKLFIVGMGEGVSKGIVQKFAEEGFKPVMFARNIEKLEMINSELSKEGIIGTVYQMDSGDENSIYKALDLAIASEGVPDVFVYNPAAIKQKNILNETFEGLLNDFKINIAGAVISASHIIKKMKSGGSGTIIFTGGGFSMYPTSDYGSLSIGKAGIKNLTQSMAQAVEGTGIKIGTVTICGFVSKDDKMYNPTSIASQYWKFYSSMGNGTDIDY